MNVVIVKNIILLISLEFAKDGEIFVPRYSCEECGKELHFKKDDVFKCPKCGEIMDFIGEILWD